METAGGRLGCVASLIVASVLSSPFMFALAWGGAHCEPQPSCQSSVFLNILWPLGLTWMGSAFFGIALRASINRLPDDVDDPVMARPLMTAGLFIGSTAAALLIGEAILNWTSGGS